MEGNDSGEDNKDIHKEFAFFLAPPCRPRIVVVRPKKYLSIQLTDRTPGITHSFR